LPVALARKKAEARKKGRERTKSGGEKEGAEKKSREAKEVGEQEADVPDIADKRDIDKPVIQGTHCAVTQSPGTAATMQHFANPQTLGQTRRRVRGIRDVALAALTRTVRVRATASLFPVLLRFPLREGFLSKSVREQEHQSILTLHIYYTHTHTYTHIHTHTHTHTYTHTLTLYLHESRRTRDAREEA
jgi:hypothetical protein